VVVETETRQDCSKVVETKTFSRVSLIPGTNRSKDNLFDKIFTIEHFKLLTKEKHNHNKIFFLEHEISDSVDIKFHDKHSQTISPAMQPHYTFPNQKLFPGVPWGRLAGLLSGHFIST
jgi:hypothetical protein